MKSNKIIFVLLCVCIIVLAVCVGGCAAKKSSGSEEGEGSSMGNTQDGEELKDIGITSVTLSLYEEDTENNTYTYGVTWQTAVHLKAPVVELIPADETSWEDAIRFTGAGKDSKYYNTYEIKDKYNYDTIGPVYKAEQEDAGITGWVDTTWYVESGITNTHNLITMYTNKLVISGLTAGETYKYRVGDASCGEYSSVGTFTAYNSKDENGEDDKNFNFIFMTDSQQPFETAKLTWGKTLKAAFENMPDAEFIAHGGDLINYNSIEQQWIELLDANKSYVMNIPIMPTAGNHEYNMVWSGGPIGYDFNNHFHVSYPKNINTSNNFYTNGFSGTYYSYDYKNVHFVVLNSNDIYVSNNSGAGFTMGEAQVEWLKEDLASVSERTDIDYTIVYMHHGLYSVGAAGLGNDSAETEVLRTQLQGIFADYGVDLVMNGHDHIYSVTEVLDREGAIVENGSAGVVYMTGAVAGNNAPGTSMFESGSTGIGTNTADKYKTIINQKAICWTELNVTSEGIKVTTYTADGGEASELDTFTIKQNNIGTTFGSESK